MDLKIGGSTYAFARRSACVAVLHASGSPSVMRLAVTCPSLLQVLFAGVAGAGWEYASTESCCLCAHALKRPLGRLSKGITALGRLRKGL